MGTTVADPSLSWYHVPEDVPLYLAVGGLDWYFEDPFARSRGLGVYGPSVPSCDERQRLFQTEAPIPLLLQAAESVVLYYHPTDGHGLESLRQNDVLSSLLAFVARKDVRSFRPFTACLSRICYGAEVWSVDHSEERLDFGGLEV